MTHTKGELHRHDLSIHIEREIDGVIEEHTCIANMNDSKHLDNEANAEHFLKCWNSHDDLLAACKDVTSLHQYSLKDFYQMRIKDAIRQCEQAIAKAKELK